MTARTYTGWAIDTRSAEGHGFIGVGYFNPFALADLAGVLGVVDGAGGAAQPAAGIERGKRQIVVQVDARVLERLIALLERAHHIRRRWK
jgi:hypothetical protein